jgi:molybdopterin synthase catalytic subunit
MVHRVGSLRVGDTAVLVAASAPHRAEAFAACRAAIEALQREVPIWKKEFSPDAAEWLG